MSKRPHRLIVLCHMALWAWLFCAAGCSAVDTLEGNRSDQKVPRLLHETVTFYKHNSDSIFHRTTFFLSSCACDKTNSVYTLLSRTSDEERRRIELSKNPNGSWSCQAFIDRHGTAIPSFAYLVDDVHLKPSTSLAQSVELSFHANYFRTDPEYSIVGEIDGLVNCPRER